MLICAPTDPASPSYPIPSAQVLGPRLWPCPQSWPPQRCTQHPARHTHCQPRAFQHAVIAAPSPPLTEKPAVAPAPASTEMLAKPALMRLATPAGVMATRLSLSKVSLGTPVQAKGSQHMHTLRGRGKRRAASLTDGQVRVFDGSLLSNTGHGS